MVDWSSVARSFGVDLVKLAFAWYAEISRPTSSGGKISSDWPCAKRQSWLEAEVDSCRDLLSKQLGCLGEREALRAALHRCDSYPSWFFQLVIFFLGLLCGISCWYLWGKISGGVVRGEPVDLVLARGLDKSAHKTRRVSSSSSGSSDDSALVSARRRARALSGRPRTPALEGGFEVSEGQ